MTRLAQPLAAPLYTAVIAVTLLGALAGCSAETPASPAPGGGDGSGTDAGSDSGGDVSTPEPGGDYADGTYTATGSYISPNGSETVDVEVTLEGNTITAVTVTPQPTNPTTSRFQSMFAGGIEAEVVGKSMDEVQVTRVAGSSLTGGGFTEALDAIRADARVD